MITWNNFQRGQCSSPYVEDGAFSKAANIDIFGQPGIARLDYLPINKNTDLTSLPRQISKDPGQSAHAYASVGNTIFKSTTSGNGWATTNGGTGSYFTIWKDYLLSFGGTDIDYYGALSETASWTSNWQTDLESEPHIGYVSKNDGNAYITNGRYVASILEKAGQDFAPETGATFTYTKQHLTLPEGYRSLALAEQRENLLVGAIQGQTAGPVETATIFVWDRVKKEYDYPVSVPGNAVNSMYSIMDRVFISVGQKGEIFQFSESGLIPFVQLPFDYDSGAIIDVGRISMGEWKGDLIVGVESEDGLNPAGVYRINLKTKKISPVITVSTGGDGADGNLYIGGVLGFNAKTLLFGWQDVDATDWGIDKITEGINKRRTSYGGYMISPFWRVGTKGNPENYSQIEIQLARALQTGEGVRLKYRTSVGTTWADATTIGTLDYATMGAVSSFIFPFGINGVENIQLKAELTTGASSTNTPYLKEIILQ